MKKNQRLLKNDLLLAKTKTCSLLLIFTLLSCGGGDSDSKKTDPTTPDPTKEDTTENTSKLDNDLNAYGVPAVDDDDNIYMLFREELMMDAPSNAVSYKNDGSLNWIFTINDNLQNIIIYNNLVIFTGLNKVYAVNKTDGTTEWDYKLTEESGFANTKGVHKPCIDSEGNIVIAVDSYLLDISTAKVASLISLKPDGTLNKKIEFATGDDYEDRFTKMSPPLATDSGLFFSVYTSISGDTVTLYKYSNDFTQLENRSYTGDVDAASSFLAASDDYIIFGLRNNDTYKTSIIKMGHSLTFNWSIDLDDYVIYSPVIDKDNNIIISCEDGYIYKLKSTDGSQLWSNNIGKIFVRGELLIGKDQKIYKFGQLPTQINMATGSESAALSDLPAGSEGAMLSDGTLVYGKANELVKVSTSAGGICPDAKWAKYGKDAANSSLYK